MEREDQQNWYLLLDSKNTPLARGYLESPPDAPNMQVRVAEDKIVDVLDHEEIQLVCMDREKSSLLGRIIMHRRDIIVLEKVKSLDAEIRENLRMPVQFESFIYPLTGPWKGRRPIRGHDLSCGGIAFFCEEVLEDGEELEIVIPITEEPLVLRCKLLRQRMSGRATPLYAAKFIDLCADEERMVREAVLNVQLQKRPPRG